MKLTGDTILITGAGSGIGRGLAERVTRYWLQPAGRRLVSALARLDSWYAEDEQCSG